MTDTVRVAAVQMAMAGDVATNEDRAEALVRSAAADGAVIVVLPELFTGPYFCIDARPEHFGLAQPLVGHPTVARFAALAAELGVVVPVSFYEQAGPATFNSVAVVDADGTVLGTYRKSHIPDGPGYSEKYYFNPGDTGFRVWETAHGTVGVGICWDQWFPEAARAMALLGAEILVYPTAIGTEPPDPTWDSRDHWQRVMQGHAGANLMPVVAANRVGTEVGAPDDGVLGHREITFHGSSFLTDSTGAILAEADRTSEAVVAATYDLAEQRAQRSSWGLFRDRRPDLYGPLLTLDGTTPAPGGRR